MKKNYLLPLIVLQLFITVTSQGQVVNGNFENVKPNFLPSNWGMNFSFPAVLDTTTGQTFTETINFTWCIPSMCYSTTDAHTGDYAFEISNAFNVTQNRVIPGNVMVFNDPEADSPGWNPGIPVTLGTQVNMLGFYYKFLPVGNDVAEAKLEVFDENGALIGEAVTEISQATNNFTYIYTPVNFTESGTPAYMYISFNMQKEGSLATFGSRLIIDDVIVNPSSLNNSEFQSSQFTIYPTVVNDELSIIKGDSMNNGKYNYTILNTEGKIIKQSVLDMAAISDSKIDLSALATGLYVIQIDQFTAKFIKK